MFCFCEHKPCQQRNRTVHSKSMRFAWAGVQHHNLNSRSYTQKPHIFNQIAFFEYYSLVRLSFHLARDLFSSSIVSVHNIHDHTYNNNDKKETNKQHNTRLKARINPRTKVLVMYPPKKKIEKKNRNLDENAIVSKTCTNISIIDRLQNWSFRLLITYGL